MAALQDRSVLLTGAGSGLGLALLDRFVQEGANLTILERSPEKVAAVERRFGPEVRCVTGDVTSPADNQRAVDAALAAHGSLDVFIGNVGVWDFNASFLGTSPSDLARAFDEMYAVNVKGYLLGARACVDALRASFGCMIFTLSNASFYPGGGGVLYTSSKHAGVGLVRQLAYELAPEVRVNAVAPGGMATDLRGPKAFGQEKQSISDVMPIGEYMRNNSALQVHIEPADYTGPYVMLASEKDARTTTGVVIDVSSVGTPARPRPSP